MNEWNVPDWRNAKSYGDTASWSQKRWRWEFYRRRKDVREYFEKYCEAEYRRKLEFFSVCPAAFPLGRVQKVDEPGFFVRVSTGDQFRIGYCYLGNPRIANQPDAILFPADQGEQISTYHFSDEQSDIGQMLESAGVSLTDRQRRKLGNSFLRSYPIGLKKGQILVYFETNLPLAPQWKIAKQIIEDEYSFYGKPVQRRAHRQKWLGYLRTIDAREDGASWSEIAEIHPATAGNEQTARDIWEAATALRFNF